MKESALRLVLDFTKKYRKPVAAGTVSLLLMIAMNIPQPFITRYLIDRVLVKGGSLNIFIYTVIFFFAVVLLRTLFLLIHRKSFGIFQEKVVFDLQVRLFKKFQYAPASTTAGWKQGYITSRIIQDVEQFRSLFFPSLLAAAKDILTLVFGLACLFYLNIPLALITLAFYPLFLCVTMRKNKNIHKINARYSEASGETMGILTESIRLIGCFKNLSKDAANVIRFYRSRKKLYLAGKERINVHLDSTIVLGLILSLIPVVIFTAGGYLVIKERMTLGTLVAFNSFTGYVFNPSRSLVHFNINFQKGVVAWERIRGILRLPGENNSGIKINNLACVRLCDVNFSYPDQVLFSNIDLDLVKGKTTGITGESGTGKTTLIRLISGQISGGGKVLVNDKELQTCSLTSYREKIGFVGQEPLLFHGTIRDNLLIASPDCSREKLDKIITQVQLDAYIRTLSLGLDTVIGEDSRNISTGQKQRIALARILLKEPAMLILDEPATGLDRENERSFIELIKSVKKDKIVLIITHRKIPLEICDEVYCLEKGRLLQAAPFA